MSFGLIKLKNKCSGVHTMTLDHFGYVLELPRHSECLFLDPNLGLLKLQDVCGTNKITGSGQSKDRVFLKFTRTITSLILLFFIVLSTCGPLEFVAIDAVLSC